MDLSILIPARNEMFLGRTIQDILDNLRGDTEVIAVLDGAWPIEPIPQHPKVTMIYHAESIGQRAATNEAAKISTAKYLMKVDAHCAFDVGFDVKLMEKMQPDWTVAPIMRNLHAFDWVCKKCGNRRYQGPTPINCPDCDNTTEFERDIVWIAKTNPQSTSYCFDPEPHFQYNGEYTKRKEYIDGIIIGYNLFFDVRMIPAEVIRFFTDLASSHQLTCSGDSLGFWKNVSSNTMGFPFINNSGSIRTSEIFGIGDESKMERITASPIFTDVVNHRDILTSPLGDATNEPRISNSMCECFISDKSASSITSLINSTNPIPTTGDIIHSNVIDKINRILGGEFIYSEKTSSFHNGSVTLIPVHDKGLTESMSLQGSCFMLTRDKYFELNICDESWGSWGSQGIEVAVKTWLSGGRVIINHNTWYAHMFRTQGGDFSFPYPLSGNQVVRAKNIAKETFFENKWPKQIHPLSWLVKKFWPVKGWSDNDLNQITQEETKPSVGVLYFTDNRLDKAIMKACQNQLLKAISGKQLVSVSLKPIDFGTNIVLPLERGYLTMFKQILAGLETLDTEIVFFAEHDILYHMSHFNFIPPAKDKYYYNLNCWKVRATDGHAIKYDTKQTSQLCAHRDLLILHYRERVRRVESEGFSRKMGFEPGSHHRTERIDDYKSETWVSDLPNIDIRHDLNLTQSRWRQDQFRDQRNCQNWQEADYVDGWYREGEFRNLLGAKQTEA